MKFEIDCFEQKYKNYVMIVEAKDEKEAREKGENGNYLELKEIEENCPTDDLLLCEGEESIRKIE